MKLCLQKFFKSRFKQPAISVVNLLKIIIFVNIYLAILFLKGTKRCEFALPYVCVTRTIFYGMGEWRNDGIRI